MQRRLYTQWLCIAKHVLLSYRQPEWYQRFAQYLHGDGSQQFPPRPTLFGRHCASFLRENMLPGARARCNVSFISFASALSFLSCVMRTCPMRLRMVRSALREPCCRRRRLRLCGRLQRGACSSPATSTSLLFSGEKHWEGWIILDLLVRESCGAVCRVIGHILASTE